MDNKKNTVSIAEYLVAKNGVTKYLKLAAKPNADDKTKKLVADLIALLGTDVLYVNLFDNEFRAKFNIPDFSKGRITVEVKPEGGATSGAKADPNGVNF
jgi:hypothetical protein